MQEMSEERGEKREQSEEAKAGIVKWGLAVGDNPVGRHQRAHQQGARNKQADHGADPRSAPKTPDCFEICSVIHGLRPAVSCFVV